MQTGIFGGGGQQGGQDFYQKTGLALFYLTQKYSAGFMF